MKKFYSFILLILAVFVFATWQYRLLMVLGLVLLNKQSVKARLSKWKHAYGMLVGGLMLAIFIAVPNYFQRGRIQLHYLDEQGERTATPMFVYALNVLFPEEELMNVGMKCAALLPPGNMSVMGHQVGSRLVRDAQNDFWTGKGLAFYHPYNIISLNGSNPGCAAMAQTCNEVLGTDYDGIYVIKPQNYDPEKIYPVVFFCHGFLGNWELYNGVLCGLKDCIVVSFGTRGLSGIFSHADIDKVFTRYIPYLKSEGYNVDENNLHLMGLSNGGTAANVALGSFSKRFRSVTYVSTSCDVVKHCDMKVLMIGGGKDASSAGLPSAHRKLKRCGTPSELYFDEKANHFILVYQAEGIVKFLNSNMINVR